MRAGPGERGDDLAPLGERQVGGRGDRGAFFSLGRAFTLDPTLVTIGEVQTEHPEAGRRQSAPPPPTEKIRHLLPQLADLPKEAETKLQTERELRAKIVELERQVSQAVKVEATPGSYSWLTEELGLPPIT